MRSYKDLNINYQGGDLDISNLKLDSLEGCPNHITGAFVCNNNQLTNLIGGPQKVDGYYLCRGNQLTDLTGCASHIGDKLYSEHNNITSFIGIHKIIKSCKAIYTDPKIIVNGGIGLLLINNLYIISRRSSPLAIISSYLGSGTKGMMACRAELIEKGFEEYAKL